MDHTIGSTARGSDLLTAHMGAKAGLGDGGIIHGRYSAVFRDGAGRIYHEEEFDNLITDVGVRLMLDSFLAGSAYTVVGPFMGLIGQAGAPTIIAGNTMGTHAGWLESGVTNAPTMSSTRLTCVWSAASSRSKALSANLTFTFTGSGTIQGVFLVTGSGAVSTVDSTAGTLFSAGTLSTAQPVISTNTLAIGYSCTLT
jgi:hypothetical protein